MKPKADSLSIGEEVVLIDKVRQHSGGSELDEIYRYDKEREARLVYRTTEEAHPRSSQLLFRARYSPAAKITVPQERVDVVPAVPPHRPGVARCRKGLAQNCGFDPQPDSLRPRITSPNRRSKSWTVR